MIPLLAKRDTDGGLLARDGVSPAVRRQAEPRRGPFWSCPSGVANVPSSAVTSIAFARKSLVGYEMPSTKLLLLTEDHVGPLHPRLYYPQRLEGERMVTWLCPTPARCRRWPRRKTHLHADRRQVGKEQLGSAIETTGSQLTIISKQSPEI